MVRYAKGADVARLDPAELRKDVPVRFDVVSVYLLPTEVEFDLYRGAFGW